jgi:hypothetical protein
VKVDSVERPVRVVVVEPPVPRNEEGSGPDFQFFLVLTLDPIQEIGRHILAPDARPLSLHMVPRIVHGAVA